MTKNSISIWLMGGFGNQLFQINKAYHLRNMGFEVSLVDNLIDRKRNTAMRILGWNIHKNVLKNLYKHDFDVINKQNQIPLLFAKLPIFNGYAAFSGLEFEALYAKNLFGYFQKKIDVVLPLKNFKGRSERFDEVVMHIRLKDNNNLSYSKAYYSRALRLMGDKKLFIVTDDKEASITLLKKHGTVNYKIISASVEEDFLALSAAEVVFCAPSTFSFWAAISNEKARTIYVPENFSNFVKVIPNNWKLF